MKKAGPKSIVFALSLISLTAVDSWAQSVAPENPPAPWDRAWYFSAGPFGGYGKLAGQTLDLPAVTQVPLQRQPAQVDTTFQAGGGALFRLTDHVVLDVGLFGGSGKVTVTETAPGLRDTLAVSSTADLHFLGGGLAGRFFPAAAGSRFQPWLSAGARGLVVRPQSGTLSIDGRTLSLDQRYLSSAGATDFTSGLGLDVRINPRLDLAISGDYGFRTGWRASLGFVLPVAPRRAVPPTAIGRTVSVGCISRSGRFCDQNGYGCLVMFPENQWSTMRNLYPGAPEMDGRVQVRPGERPSLYFEFTAAPSPELARLPIDRDISLDKSIATALGFRRVTILKGVYEIDRRLGRFGGVIFNVLLDSSASDGIQVANPDNPQDDFGRAHNDGISYFRSRVLEAPGRVLTDDNFAAEFQAVMTPWARKTSQDPRFLRMMGTSDSGEVFRQMADFLNRIKNEPALQDRLKLTAGSMDEPSGTSGEPEWKIARDTYRDILLQARLLDGECIDYEQYQRQIRLVESRVLEESTQSSGSILARRLTSLARYNAALLESDEKLDTKAKSFPWGDVLGGDFHGALDGATVGGLTGPGGAGAGAIIGGLFGSSWALYEHGYIKD